VSAGERLRRRFISSEWKSITRGRS